MARPYIKAFLTKINKISRNSKRAPVPNNKNDRSTKPTQPEETTMDEESAQEMDNEETHKLYSTIEETDKVYID